MTCDILKTCGVETGGEGGSGSSMYGYRAPGAPERGYKNYRQEK